MPMMGVGEMQMEVAQWNVRVGMVVGFLPIPGKVVDVLMVFVMGVHMGVG